MVFWHISNIPPKVSQSQICTHTHRHLYIHGHLFDLWLNGHAYWKTIAHECGVHQLRNWYCIRLKILSCFTQIVICSKLIVALWCHIASLIQVMVFKSSQIKSNQVYCYTNNTHNITPYNKYNVTLHLKYIFQLHLTQLKVQYSKGSRKPGWA